MPIVCKALKIERWRWLESWRGLVNLVLLAWFWIFLQYRKVSKLRVHFCSRMISRKEHMIILSTFENVHHANEPHILGNTTESRVDTEVQTMPYTITSSTARAPTCYRQTTNKIQQQSSASRVWKGKCSKLLHRRRPRCFRAGRKLTRRRKISRE